MSQSKKNGFKASKSHVVSDVYSDIGGLGVAIENKSPIMGSVAMYEEVKGVKQKPEIFEFINYREYLDAFYQYKKKQNSSYSYKVFARRADVAASSLPMILSGKRNLTEKAGRKFASALDLDFYEQEYFENLIKFNQTDDEVQRAQFENLLKSHRYQKKLNKMDRAKYDFFAKWYMVAIYVMVGMESFDPDPRWIMKRLKRRVSSLETSNALEELEKLGLIGKSSEGKYKQLSGSITTEEENRSQAITNYHSSMTSLAQAAIAYEKKEDIEFNGATVSIPRSELPKFKEKIREFRKEINKLASSLKGSTDVYQLNVSFFPLTDKDEKK